MYLIIAYEYRLGLLYLSFRGGPLIMHRGTNEILVLYTHSRNVYHEGCTVPPPPFIINSLCYPSINHQPPLQHNVFNVR